MENASINCIWEKTYRRQNVQHWHRREVMTNASDKLREEFRTLWVELKGPYRYTKTKYRYLLTDRWEWVKKLARGEDQAVAPPAYAEVHPCEPCQLSCKFCRGLREVPHRQVVLSTEHLLSIIENIASMNSSASLRFSGEIGDPLLHPEIENAFRRTTDLGLAWAVTTNGLLLHRGSILSCVLSAQYVHVSLDAGSDAVYVNLKGGKPGDFHRVISNLERLALRKGGAAARVEIVVSVLLQSENFREIPALSKTLKSIGVDTLELKMQHFDPRRAMAADEVQAAWDLIRAVRELDEGDGYRVISVQNVAQALVKISPLGAHVAFPVCYAGMLGLTSTIDPRGTLQSCCQYSQPTLGEQGRLGGLLKDLWYSGTRLNVLRGDPRQMCSSCSPSDEVVNRFVDFLRVAYQRDPTILEWVEREFIDVPRIESSIPRPE